MNPVVAHVAEHNNSCILNKDGHIDFCHPCNIFIVQAVQSDDFFNGFHLYVDGVTSNTPEVCSYQTLQ